MAALIEGRSLNKVFGRRSHRALELIEAGEDKSTIFARTGCAVAVRDASFSVESGEIFVVMGLSGSGKSTLLRLVNRLIEPSSGTVQIDGIDITAMSRHELIRLRRERLTMVFQTFALMPHLRVRDNVAFGLDVAGMAKQERRSRVTSALEMVGLAAHADSYPDELSGGMQQRVGLARALASKPNIMLMDEAFSALDPLIRKDMQDELLRLRDEQDLTIVFVSHDLDEAMRIGDRIAIMADGRILQIGTPQQILEEPADRHVRHFFGGVDIANVYTAGDLARTEPAAVRVRDGSRLSYVANVLRRSRSAYGYLHDGHGHYRGVVSLDGLIDAMQQGHEDLGDARVDCQPVGTDASFNEVVARLAHLPCSLPVVDADGHLVGTISRTLLLETMEQQRS